MAAGNVCCHTLCHSSSSVVHRVEWLRFPSLSFISTIFPVYLFIFIVFGLVFITSSRRRLRSRCHRSDCCCFPLFSLSFTEDERNNRTSFASCTLCPVCQCARIAMACLLLCMCASCTRLCEMYLPKLSLWFAICSSSVNRLGYAHRRVVGSAMCIAFHSPNNYTHIHYNLLPFLCVQSEFSASSVPCLPLPKSLYICVDNARSRTKTIVFSIE